ncbi:MAG: AraC family transcriptional regulator [Alphaproteobacteria bacterium]|nr:AraC family transcriptional regulator [Alphaproteobacteria bacterium]MCW5739867.1 AraC family transcriptional regulator [Alphaproteobacteria bacterium]
MASHIGVPAPGGLERSCGDWIRVAPPEPGLERVEARFAGHAYDPHRHDTYAIGCTLGGVQSFRYRGSSESSVAGQVFVLHPDETHDGHAGTEDGFRYRILYVEPGVIRDALGGECRTLPFVRDTVSSNRRIAGAIAPALEGLDRPLEELRRDQVILDLAEALAAADSSLRPRRLSARDWRAVGRAREMLEANLTRGVTSAELEGATGQSRYALTRHFRACLGTSPYRYLVMRRLDRARSLMRSGASLALAAAASGFADQSHMTRLFHRAYGLPPGQWIALQTHISS